MENTVENKETHDPSNSKSLEKKNYKHGETSKMVVPVPSPPHILQEIHTN